MDAIVETVVEAQDASEAVVVTGGDVQAALVELAETPVVEVPLDEVPMIETELVGDLVPLVEKNVRSDGTIPVRIIAPGWGSSGYYPANVLERDGPRVFTKGMHTYWDHPSLSEEKDRPERSLRSLAGVLTRDAHWDANGPAGPGLYSEAQVRSRYRTDVEELAPYIGMSIRAFGKVMEGEADGRRGKVINELASARSVDYVTAAGAGGKILALFEAAGREPAESEDIVTEQEAQTLRDENARLIQEKADLAAQVATLKETVLVRQAQDVAVSVLAEMDLPAVARQRVLTAPDARPTVAEDGSFDEAAYRTQIEAAGRAEMAYVREMRGASGRITGMGGSAAPAEGKAQLKESYRSMYLRQGKSAEEAERMATVAAQGR